ncbi:MAG: peptidase M61, partial [Pseudomonadota bacterium]
MNIVYTLDVAQARAHRFAVTIDIASPEPTGQQFTLPSWIPGSYLVRDFARFISTVQATDERGPVLVDKVDKHTWRCAPSRGALRVAYEVYAWDQSVRGAHLDDTHGFCNGANVFLAVTGQESAPVAVELVQPQPDGVGAHWQIATTLPRDGAKPRAFGRYRAADYDELIDHPIEMGRFEMVSCEVAGVPHRLALSGRHHCDGDRLARDVERICAEHVRMFGELPPMPEYLFLTRVLREGYGGLEHRASSALVCSRDQLPGVDATTNKRYQSFLGLVSHEYFHLWNVKRIKPAAFTPYRLERESYT